MTKRDPQLLAALRGEIVTTIAKASAYDVPSLCVRVGLEPGTDEEAMRSKARYAAKRLAATPASDLPRIARELLADGGHYDLSEALAKLEEAGTSQVSELTRRRIIGLFERCAIATEIDDIELLRRVWPLARMPSRFNRQSLEDDVYQATINNDDWTNRELLEVLGLLTCSKAQLFRFLAEVVDPVVQTEARQCELVARINGHLRHDGYALTEAGRISGSPRYEVRQCAKGAPSDASISAALKAFNPDAVHARWEAAMARRDAEPAGAITLARTLLEDVCKWILTEAGEAFRDDDDLPALYRKLAKVLKLAPDAHTEQVFKQILGSCQSVVETLGALRNKLGDAHSQGPRRARPAARHAELAVNLSGAMATFLIATWRARQGLSEEDDTQKKASGA